MAQQKIQSLNCEACGVEEIETELTTVKLSSFTKPLHICKICLARKPEESFKDAADILGEISAIATGSSNPEERLKMVKKILGVNGVL
jgi:hypothetical protein